MTIQDIVKEATARMETTLEDARRRFSAIRTGRASVNLLDGIQVESYGTVMPLNQLANISAPEAALITVQPWDTSLLGAIERAIQSSDLGITPSNDGKIIRLPIPPLTEERRKQLARTVRDTAEEHRTGLRNIRRDANEEVKNCSRKNSSRKTSIRSPWNKSRNRLTLSHTSSTTWPKPRKKNSCASDLDPLLSARHRQQARPGVGFFLLKMIIILSTLEHPIRTRRCSGPWRSSTTNV